jgi:SCY1-like protein 1
MASFLTDLAKRALGSASSNLPFKIEELVESETDTIWEIYNGTKDNINLTLFVFNISKFPDKTILARNALKKAKVIRYPDCLRYIEGVETETQIIIATESVASLRSYLNNNKDEYLIRLGLYKLSNTLKFFEDSQLVHGLIGVDSIFVTKSGEWKLGNFSLLSSLKEDHNLVSTHGYLFKNRVLPPELCSLRNKG